MKHATTMDKLTEETNRGRKDRADADLCQEPRLMSPAEVPAGDPFLLLIEEHDTCNRLLGGMDNAVESIRLNGFSADAFRQISDAVRFIDSAIRLHHEREETYLFPLIERHNPGSTEVMRKEHRSLWSALRQLLRIVQDIEEGRLHGTSIRELLQTSRFIIDLVASHTRRENHVLFPMARKTLTTTEWNELRSAIAVASPRHDRVQQHS
jgi:hemerythrin-like domain-containing protein